MRGFVEWFVILLHGCVSNLVQFGTVFFKLWGIFCKFPRMLGDRMMVHALSSEKSKNLVSYQLIEQPSLIILGQDDTFILPSLWEQPERAFKDVTVQIVQHCSHWVPFDRPDEVNQLITQFLQSN
eukprot:TRINITY_DN10628_c1_g1_i1.p3 TRINITY_DN10628_c1_g1~~TRINITY_DN10628_c1_g1_i1.p3  ORF type:complete len:125 (-),score=4.67 TRINITY_DN10628_c1_g1_i1:453-827(-)